MPAPYTQGVWQVKPGRADEFVAAWTEFAEWTVQKHAPSNWRIIPPEIMSAMFRVLLDETRENERPDHHEHERCQSVPPAIKPLSTDFVGTACCYDRQPDDGGDRYRGEDQERSYGRGDPDRGGGQEDREDRKVG